MGFQTGSKIVNFAKKARWVWNGQKNLASGPLSHIEDLALGADKGSWNLHLKKKKKEKEKKE